LPDLIADYSGARGSNAGDQFHELWALDRALSLLNPSTDLKALTVEGIQSSEDSGAKGEPAWDGVDCALYYGGRSLETASRVEIAQLKYSGSNPDSPWTIARLTANTRKSGNNSVVAKLAESFSDARTRMKVGSPLTIRLISNQPVSLEVSRLLSLYQTASPSEASLETEATEHLKKISDATELTGNDLSAFLKAIDVSECGSTSRFAKKEAIVTWVAEAVGDDAGAQVRELQTRIRELMLPERKRDVITFEVVLGWFDIASPHGLFPAPADIKPVKDAILRQPARRLADTVANGSRITCLHGPAGCGKTTTLGQLGELLPDGSTFIIFDCYGGGRYIYSNDLRHLPQNAYTEIANELSLKLGIPFLLAADSASADINRFLARIRRAGEALGKVQPEALLVIGIDAADNSIAAAEKAAPPDKCFVRELAHADLSGLPGNVRLVFSARSARRDKLELPNTAVEIPCPAFEFDETCAFIRTKFPDASNDWIQQFHALSRGVPRVQDYAVSAGNGDAEATLNALRPGGKVVNDVLRQLFQSALTRAGHLSLYNDFVAALAALPAPAPMRHLASVCGTSESDVLDLVNDIRPSLRAEPEGISIADEDVEDFIRDEGRANLASLQDRCRCLFSDIYRADSYAATHYADFLVATGHASEILPILEKDLSPAGIADPVVRREVQVRRLRLALAACRSAGAPADTMKVVLLSAEAAKDEAVLTEILRKEPDLAVRFARASLTRLVLANPKSAYRQGSVLVENAVRAIRSRDPITAREQLHLYNVWLKRQRDVTKNEREKWIIKDEDVLAHTEAIALLNGPGHALHSLRTWRPIHLPLQIGLALVPRLIARGNADLVKATLDRGLLQRVWDFLLIVPIALSGQPADRALLGASLRSLRRKLIPLVDAIDRGGFDSNWQVDLLELVVTACEIGLAIGVERKAIEHALRLVIVPDAPPKKRYYGGTDARLIGVMLRAWLLHHYCASAKVALEDFQNFLDPVEPEEDKSKKANARSSKQKPSKPTQDAELRKCAKAIYPVYEGRMAIIERAAAGHHQGEDDIAPIKALGLQDYEFAREYWASAYRAEAARSVLRLMHLSDLPIKPLFKKAQELVKTRYSDPFGDQLRPLWEELLVRSECHDLILQEVSQKATETKSAKAPASEKVRAYLNFSRLTLNFSEPDAQAFFEQVITLAQEIDREALDQIGVLDALATHFTHWPKDRKTAAACQAFRFVTDVALRLEGEEHFPWDDAVRCLARLSPEAAFASISQWSDKAIRTHEFTLSTLLLELNRIEVLPVECSVALLALLERKPSDLLSALAKSPASQAKWLLAAEELARDCLLDAAPVERQKDGELITKAIEAAGRSAEGAMLLHLKDLLAFLSRPPVSVAKREEDQESNKEKQLLDLSGRIFLTPAAIEQAVKDAGDVGEYSLKGLFNRMMATVTAPGDRVAFLNALAEFRLDPYLDGERLAAIAEALRTWSAAPSVAQWRSLNFSTVVTRYFCGLVRWLNRWSDELEKFLEMASFTPAEQRTILIDGVESAGVSLGSSALFSIAEYLAVSLDPTDGWVMIDWFLARLNTRIKGDDICELVASDLPGTLDDTLGRFIFALLSDIDVRIRWRAAHVMRRFARLGAVAPFQAVFSNYDRKSDVSFRDPNAPYYWIAARLWSVIAAARVANETPELVLPMADKLRSIALDREFPHVLVREHAKLAVLQLADSGHLVLPAADYAAVKNVNSPALPRAPKAERTDEHAYRESRDRRFHFDMMDAAQYWFAKPMRMFADLKGKDFYDRLEYWAADKWNAPEKVKYWDLEPRKARYSERRYYLYSTSHGSLPTLERYGTHLEWSSMFCGVGQLLETHALAEKRDDWDSFESWLQDHMLTFPPFWLSDLRDLTPLVDLLWYDSSQNDSHWIAKIAEDQFLLAFRPAIGDASFITVDGQWTAQFPTRGINVRLSGALVSANTAPALLRLLQSAQHAYGSSFPLDDGDDNRAFDEAPFVLRGWLKHVSQDTRFDGKDPFNNGISPSVIGPGDSTIKALGLRPGAIPGKQWFRGETNEIAFRAIQWSDLPERGDEWTRREQKSDGRWLQVHADALMDLLREQKLDLILGIHIERRLESEYGRPYERETKKTKAIERLFILRSDGSIEDIKGRIGTWAKARH
jgi:hypothetical protein